MTNGNPHIYLATLLLSRGRCLMKINKGLKSKYRLIILLLLGIFLSIPYASAYINPGTASIFWQLILALVLGLAFTVRIYWTKIAGAFRKKPNKSTKKQ